MKSNLDIAHECGAAYVRQWDCNEIVHIKFTPAQLNAFAERIRAAAEGECKPVASPACWCQTCRPMTWDDMRMVFCPTCGNKRCPRANDHRNLCTGSNVPGQPGSAYPSSPQKDQS